MFSICQSRRVEGESLSIHFAILTRINLFRSHYLYSMCCGVFLKQQLLLFCRVISAYPKVTEGPYPLLFRSAVFQSEVDISDSLAGE